MGTSLTSRAKVEPDGALSVVIQDQVTPLIVTKFSKLLKKIKLANSNPVETNKKNWKAYQENNKIEKARRYLKKKSTRLKKDKIPKWYKYQCKKLGVEYAN